MRKGTRGSKYFYVLEGDELVHISEYAIARLPGKWEDQVIYEVPLDKVSGKPIYHFSFTRSGNAFLRRSRIEDFKDGYPEKGESISFDEIRGFKFRVKSPKLSLLLKEFSETFALMRHELHEYAKWLNFDYSFMGHAKRIREALFDPELYYFRFMSLPKDDSRTGSIKATRRWLYQLWVLKLACECLETSEFSYHVHEGKPYWWIEQGSEYSTFIAETPWGNITAWIEFQVEKWAHLAGLFKPKRVPTRPDLVLVKGHFRTTRNFVDSKKRMDVLIECKEDPYGEWEKDADEQILPYLEVFEPRRFILASLRLVPSWVKAMLGRKGIEVVDELRPKSENIKMLRDILREVLGG